MKETKAPDKPQPAGKPLPEDDPSRHWFKGPSVDKDAVRKDTAASPDTIGPRK